MTPREVVDFISMFDRDRDGGWSYDEFVAMLNTQVDENEEDSGETFEQSANAGGEPLLYRTQTGSTHDHISPMRTTSIARLESADAKARQFWDEIRKKRDARITLVTRIRNWWRAL